MVSTPDIAKLEPAEVMKAFAEISAIPRCSKCEDAIIAWIVDEMKKLGHSCRRDAVGNLLVTVAPSPGHETLPGIILQGHVDMVCEREKNSSFDFSKQGLDLWLDGDWLKARETSLGADNGIAVAMMIAVARGACAHGPVDLLFTIDEETGLTGAIGLDPSMLRHDYLLNIDSEEEEILYIGCAGGVETVGDIALERSPVPVGLHSVRLTVEGLLGGHSGTDIHDFRGNALLMLGRILWHEAKALPYRICEIHGGDKHNVIPREAWADLALTDQELAHFESRISWWQEAFIEEFGDREPNVKVVIQKGPSLALALTQASRDRVVAFMRTIWHGVIAMSRHIDGLVATSTNFAAFNFGQTGPATVLTSQRSDTWAAIHDAADRVSAAIVLSGGTAREVREYPGWTPDPSSPLLKLGMEVYRENYGREPIIKSIHAGLETGVIGSKRASIKMLSCGPDIRGAHSPMERLNVPSTVRVWQFVQKLLLGLGRISK